MSAVEVRARNDRRSREAQERLARALEAPTLAEARLIFSQRRPQGLGEAARRYGRYDEYKARFGDDIVERRKGAKERTEKAKKASSLDRLKRALSEGSTRAEAAAIYGTSIAGMSAAATKKGLRAEYEEKFGEEMRDAARERLLEISAKGRAAQSATAAVKWAAVEEDAEFLAESGEGKDHAASRLGYDNWDALERALHLHDRSDLSSRFYANEFREGVIPQGRSPQGAW